MMVHYMMVNYKYVPIEPICGYQSTSIYGTQPDWCYVKDRMLQTISFRLSVLKSTLDGLTDHAGMLLVVG